MLREGLAAIIGSQDDLVLIAEAGTGKQAIALFEQHRPDITLMDLRLPDIHGIDAILAIRDLNPQARIIVLTTYLGDVQALRALKAGALGYLLKASLRRDLLDTIRAVHAGHRRVPPDVATEMAEHAMDDSLTGREIEVLREVAAGCSNKLVADLRGKTVISPFLILCKVADGKVIYMQYMEDTFATSSTFQSGGAWLPGTHRIGLGFYL